MDKHISNFDHYMNILKLCLLAMVIIIVGLFLMGCSPEPTQKVQTAEGKEYGVTIVDGCEYIRSPSAHGQYVLTHKGNCTNTIHVYRMENK